MPLTALGGLTALFLIMGFVMELIGFSGAAGNASRYLKIVGAIPLMVALGIWLLKPRPRRIR